jgi:hypothetical protein
VRSSLMCAAQLHLHLPVARAALTFELLNSFRHHLCCCSNCLTGAAVEQQDTRPYRAAAQQLGLSPLQKQRIAAGLPVFKQLQQAVLDELQHLQQQPAEEAEAATDSWDEQLQKPQLPMGMVQSCSSWQAAQQRNRQRTQRYGQRKDALAGGVLCSMWCAV